MEIIVEIHKGEDGRPAGTVRTAAEAGGRPFSGNLEFLALVENLYLAETTPAPCIPDDQAGLSDKTELSDNTDRRAQ
jgi:hypothetical protein